MQRSSWLDLIPLVLQQENPPQTVNIVTCFYIFLYTKIKYYLLYT